MKIGHHHNGFISLADSPCFSSAELLRYQFHKDAHRSEGALALLQHQALTDFRHARALSLAETTGVTKVPPHQPLLRPPSFSAVGSRAWPPTKLSAGRPPVLQVQSEIRCTQKWSRETDTVSQRCDCGCITHSWNHWQKDICGRRR